MAARLRERKHTVVIAKLPGNDNVVNAKVIRDIVAARGWTKVAIVGHSMGGLSGRQYIRFDGGRKVATVYVSLGTPQRGLPIACFLRPDDGGQMCPDSAFLTKLNAGDETPGPTTWTSVYSTTDGLVPTSASRLVDGACDVKVTGPNHSQLLTDRAVFRIVLGAIDGKPCPGVFVK
jgi:triacylglycerol lipase